MRLAVLISGRGTNLQALIDACAQPGFPASIALVVSNRSDAPGLARARAAGLASRLISHRQHASRESFERALDEAVRAVGAELVCLAGFMRVLGPWFVGHWRDRLINIHPSLLPAFPGLEAQARALAAGVRLTGCTVHFVREAVDDGPIIVQAAVPVLPGDDTQSLTARILDAEHRCYPLAVRLIAEGRVRVEGERTVIEAAPGGGMLMNPSLP